MITAQIDIPACDEFVNFILENDSTVNPKAAALKYKAWIENGWKDGYNKPIKSWKTKALNIIQYLEKVKEQPKQENKYPIFR